MVQYRYLHFPAVICVPVGTR